MSPRNVATVDHTMSSNRKHLRPLTQSTQYDKFTNINPKKFATKLKIQ